jgi:hypothetical protein
VSVREEETKREEGRERQWGGGTGVIGEVVNEMKCFSAGLGFQCRFRVSVHV